MKHLGLIKTAACATLLLAAVSPRAARADNWDRKTTISFSDAVQIPGATLPAGKYIFKLWDSQSDRYVVQIFNERQNHVYATLLTIPEYRQNPPDQTVISFYEAPAGQPQPIKAWFYPGDHNGREFIYSKAEANTIASVAHETVPSDVTAVSENALVYAPQPPPAVDPDADHSADDDSYVAYPAATAPVVTPPESTEESPVVDDDAQDQPQPAPAPQDPPATDSTMPSTGSELPLAALIGLSSIGAAFSVRAIRSARRNEVG
jgi:hypothetical protein